MAIGQAAQRLGKRAQISFKDVDGILHLQHIGRVHDVLGRGAPVDVGAGLAPAGLGEHPDHRNDRMDRFVDQGFDAGCIQPFGPGAGGDRLGGLHRDQADLGLRASQRNLNVQPTLQQAKIIKHSAHRTRSVQVFQEDRIEDMRAHACLSPLRLTCAGQADASTSSVARIPSTVWRTFSRTAAPASLGSPALTAVKIA